MIISAAASLILIALLGAPNDRLFSVRFDAVWQEERKEGRMIGESSDPPREVDVWSVGYKSQLSKLNMTAMRVFCRYCSNLQNCHVKSLPLLCFTHQDFTHHSRISHSTVMALIETNLSVQHYGERGTVRECCCCEVKGGRGGGATN